MENRTYSDVFCKVYNEFGWNYYPEIFGQQLLAWMENRGWKPESAMDLGCGTGILCQLLHQSLSALGINTLDRNAAKTHAGNFESGLA